MHIITMNIFLHVLYLDIYLKAFLIWYTSVMKHQGFGYLSSLCPVLLNGIKAHIRHSRIAVPKVELKYHN